MLSGFLFGDVSTIGLRPAVSCQAAWSLTDPAPPPLPKLSVRLAWLGRGEQGNIKLGWYQALSDETGRFVELIQGVTLDWSGLESVQSHRDTL